MYCKCVMNDVVGRFVLVGPSSKPLLVLVLVLVLSPP